MTGFDLTILKQAFIDIVPHVLYNANRISACFVENSKKQYNALNSEVIGSFNANIEFAVKYIMIELDMFYHSILKVY